MSEDRMADVIEDVVLGVLLLIALPMGTLMVVWGLR
jgi:hypothetical protein